MSTERNNNGSDNGQGDDIISGAEMNRAAKDAFKSFDALGKSNNIGQTKEFLGLVTMDAGIVDVFDGLYNAGADFISHSVRPRIFALTKAGLTSSHAQKAFTLSDPAANKVAAIASIGTAATLKSVGYLGPIYKGITAHWDEQRDLAQKLGPVLDDIKGNHSMTAFLMTSAKDNEVIFAHRKRLSKIANSTNVSNITNLAVSAGGSMLLDVKAMAETWNHRATGGMAPNADASVTAQTAANAASAQLHGPVSLQTMKTGIITMLPQIAKRMVATNEYKLRTELQPYSALDMIFELSEQMNNGDTDRFAVPRSYQSPQGKREQLSLESYLMRICIQHQKEMAFLDPKHTEIRDALREDLAAAVKPLAEDIRKGDFNVLGLVRLVGEGKIIKKQGRAIASANEIKALIEKEEPKQTKYAPVDPNEYYKEATFSKAQLKTALKALEGEEKNTFAAMFPDNILLEAGMSKQEVKTVRDTMTTKYDHILVEAIMGLNEKSDDVLKGEGLAHAEIEQIRGAAKAILGQGEEALHDLKTSAVNDHGIEHLLVNVMVHQPQNMIKIQKDGRTVLEDQPEMPDASNAPKHTVEETPTTRIGVAANHAKHEGKVAKNQAARTA